MRAEASAISFAETQVTILDCSLVYRWPQHEKWLSGVCVLDQQDVAVALDSIISECQDSVLFRQAVGSACEKFKPEACERGIPYIAQDMRDSLDNL